MVTCTSYWLDVPPPPSFSARTVASNDPRAQPWGSRPIAWLASFENQHILSQAWTLLQSVSNARCEPAFATYVTQPKSRHADCVHYPHLPRFLPPLTFPRRRERRTTGGDCHVPPLRLRPQDFSPSRRFAPPATCRACFIPNPPLGFSLRGMSRCTAGRQTSRSSQPS